MKTIFRLWTKIVQLMTTHCRPSIFRHPLIQSHFTPNRIFSLRTQKIFQKFHPSDKNTSRDNSDNENEKELPVTSDEQQITEAVDKTKRTKKPLIENPKVTARSNNVLDIN